MTRLIPNPPPPNAQITADGKLPDHEYVRFLRETIDSLRHRLPITGTATFVAATSIAVVLENELPDAEYRVPIEASENNTFWVTAKTETGFTINAASSTSATVGWTLTKD